MTMLHWKKYIITSKMRNMSKNKSDLSSKLTLEQVEHVAKLAKLKLSKVDLEKFKNQLSSILDLVGKLSEIDTLDVNPTSQVTQMENIFREDIVDEKRILSQKEVLSNAKRTHNGYFVVDAIFE